MKKVLFHHTMANTLFIKYFPDANYFWLRAGKFLFSFFFKYQTETIQVWEGSWNNFDTLRFMLNIDLGNSSWYKCISVHISYFSLQKAFIFPQALHYGIMDCFSDFIFSLKFLLHLAVFFPILRSTQIHELFLKGERFVFKITTKK